MPDLPARVIPVLNQSISKRERQVIAVRRTVEDAVLGHELEMHYRKEVALIEMRAAGEVSASSIDIEIGFYKEALEKVAGSSAAAALIADHLQDLKETNRRIFRETFR